MTENTSVVDLTNPYFGLSSAATGLVIGEDGFKVDSGPVVKYNTNLDDAFRAAQNEASSRSGRLLPAICYKQGVRRFLVTAMPWSAILKQVQFDSAEKGKDPEDRRNRPIDKSHYRNIAKYVQETPNYILPPITLCMESRLNFYVGFIADAGSNPSTMMGHFVLPDDQDFFIQDGQHRCKGLEDVIGLQKKYGGDSVAVSIALEKDIDQIHQDFADCARTQPIAASLLAIYNTRDPLSMFVKEVTSNILVFKGRTEKTSQSVSKKSQKIFTTNNLRQALVVLMTGSRSNAGNVGETRPAMLEVLEPDAVRSETVNLATDFFETFTASHDLWNRIASIEPESTDTTVSEKRGEYLSLSATGLLVMCEVGYDIINKFKDQPMEMRRLIGVMARIDWTRNGPLWVGNVVQNGNVVNQSRNHLQEACNNIRKELNKTLPEESKMEIKKSKKETEAAAAAEVAV
jgi:DNA sulfur modification protein DndB